MCENCKTDPKANPYGGQNAGHDGTYQCGSNQAFRGYPEAEEIPPVTPPVVEEPEE